MAWRKENWLSEKDHSDSGEACASGSRGEVQTSFRQLQVSRYSREIDLESLTTMSYECTPHPRVVFSYP